MGIKIMEETREDVFSYIKREETEFQTHGVPVIDGWEFSMHEHIRRSILYKYGQLWGRTKTDDDPVENIILPILNVAYRLEDIEVKQITPYVNSDKDSHKSLFVKKFHDRWARKNEVDTFFDKVKTEWIDFGLGLVKKSKKPEHVPLQRLAFCDQTDILSLPICEKHQFTPEQLNGMKGRWDADAIDEVIVLSREEKSQQQVKATKQKTPGRYIEVYELHGVFPEDWNPQIKNPDPDKFSPQIHVITYYRTKDLKDKGIALYQGADRNEVYDAIKRDEIYGRACGYGAIEELFEPQVWHTYSRIQMKEMLDTAALMIVKTTDAGLAKRQKITNLEKGEMLEVEDGKDASQLIIQPINWQVFDKWREDMKLAAQTQGSANDPQLGVEPKSGTPFALQRLTTVQGQGIHEYRRGIFSAFIEKLYRKWFLGQMVAEMNRGDKWIEEFSLEEIKWIADKVSQNQGEIKKKNIILSGKIVRQAEIDEYKETIKQQILGRDKISIELIKDELKDIPIDVKVDVAGKQKNLTGEIDKIIMLIQTIISTRGAILETPGMEKLLNQVIEYLGLDPIDFSSQRQMPREVPQATPQLAPAV